MRARLSRRVDAALAALYERAKDRLSETEFLARVRAASEEFGGLLDDEAIALLVLDELGLNEGAYVTLDDLAGRSEATARVRIDRVEPPRTFTRQGGGEGRVCNCLVSDATGTGRIVLWDRDVDKVEDGTLYAGARLTLVNARVKEGRYGIELHVGPWTVLEVEGALDPAKRKLLADVAPEPANAPEPPAGPARVEGVLKAVAPTRTYLTERGVGFVCEVDVETRDGLVRLVVRDELVKAVRALSPGARVVVAPVEAKARGAYTEWHATPETRITTA